MTPSNSSLESSSSSEEATGKVYQHYKNINSRKSIVSQDESSQLNVSPEKELFNTPQKGIKSLYSTPFIENYKKVTNSMLFEHAIINSEQKLEDMKM